MIDLDLYAAALRRYLAAILAGALAIGLAVGAAFAFLGGERAEGVYTVGTLEYDAKKQPPLQFQGGISPHQFKTIAPRFDPKAFSAYVARSGDLDERAVARVQRALGSEERRRDLLAPIYGTTRGDLRELGESAKPQENAVLGLRIAHVARDGDLALRVVSIAGDFVGDTVLRTALRDLMLFRARASEAERLLAENVLINARFATKQLESKGEALEKLRSAYPEVLKSAPQQVVSVADGGARYLAPAVQVVGVESLMAEHREKIASSERTMRKNDAQRGYYQRALHLLSEPISGQRLLDGLNKAVEASFPLANDADGVHAEARNEALLELGVVNALRTRGLQFVTDPVIVEREPLHAVRIGATTAMLVVAAGLLALLAQVWWRSNRHTLGVQA